MLVLKGHSVQGFGQALAFCETRSSITVLVSAVIQAVVRVAVGGVIVASHRNLRCCTSIKTAVAYHAIISVSQVGAMRLVDKALECISV